MNFSYIETLHNQLQQVSGLFQENELHYKKLNKNSWTIKDILIHIKDADTTYYERLRRVVSENKPVVWAFEQDLWQTKLDYINQDIELAKELFISTRKSIIELIQMHFEKYKNNEVVHSFRGIQTMEEIIQFIVWHTQHHIEQINKIVSIV